MFDTDYSPPKFSFHTASPARVYDWLLGGKDHYPADREAGEKLVAAFPQAPTLAEQNRGFLLRAVRYCAEAGIGQFIDLGAGFPTSPNVAEVACAVNPAARVVGVDNDPIVLSHQRAKPPSTPGEYAIVEGDVRRPWAILADADLNAVIDLSRPVAVLCVAVLHFIPDTDDPAAIVRALTQAIVSGSFVALSAVTSTDTDPDVIAQIEAAYANASAPAVFRATEQIRSWFTGLDLAPPGLVEASHWPIPTAASTDVRILAGLGRKQ
jgi:hypothetical protein